MPAPRDCDLYIVNRDALFSYHTLSEGLLQRIWALYTSAHYKNSPNDLQMLSDAPAHRLFVLLGPQRSGGGGGGSTPALPDVLCVVQVAFEGLISQQSVQSEISRGNRASGDLIPWTVSQQFCDNEFPSLSGARIVRIATHPDVQKMGYGSRALDLLTSYFEGDLSAGAGPSPAVGEFGGEGGRDTKSIDRAREEDVDLLGEVVKPRAKLPPLLIPLSERPAERLHWLGSSFGITPQLLNFWGRKGFRVCYVRQTANDLTGENSSIVLRELSCQGMEDAPTPGWLDAYKLDYRRRLVSLMGFAFTTVDAAVAISLLDPDRLFTAQTTAASSAMVTGDDEDTTSSSSSSSASSSRIGLYGATLMTADELLSVHLTHHDMKRLELYSRNMVDHHMILDLLSTISRMFFLGRLSNVRLSHLQVAILVGMGLQNRDVDSISTELDLPSNQVLAFFNKTIRKISSALKSLIEAKAASEMASDATIAKMGKRASAMNALRDTLEEDQRQDTNDFSKKQRELLMATKDLSKHAVTADVSLLASAYNKGVKKSKVMPSSFSIPVAAQQHKVDEEKDGEGDEGVTSGGHATGKEKKKKQKKNKHREESGSGEGMEKQKKKRRKEKEEQEADEDA